MTAFLLRAAICVPMYLFEHHLACDLGFIIISIKIIFLAAKCMHSKVSDTQKYSKLDIFHRSRKSFLRFSKLGHYLTFLDNYRHFSTFLDIFRHLMMRRICTENVKVTDGGDLIQLLLLVVYHNMYHFVARTIHILLITI